MFTPNIIITTPNNSLNAKLKVVLESSNFHIAGICLSGNDALRKTRTIRPDLLLINYELSDMTGLCVAEIVTENKLCPVILLANQTQKEYAEQRVSYPYLICISKPVNKAVLLNSIEIALKSREGIKKLEREISDLKEGLKERKILEKAKGILMKQLGINEDEAYRKIQKQSMNSGTPMKDIAQVIIDTLGE